MSEKSRPAQWKADLTLAFVALLWGTTFVVVKQALAEISTFYFLALRFSVASICMGVAIPGAVRQVNGRAALRAMYAGAVTGVFLAVGYVLQTFGLRYTSAGNSGFLTGLYIVLVPLFAAAIYRRWPRPAELLGVSVAGGGMILLTFPSLDPRRGLNVGDMLTVGCAIAFALHLLVLGYYSRREKFEMVAFGQIACVAGLCGFALLLEPPKATWNSGVIAAIAVTGVLATALAFFLQTWAQQYTSATRAAVLFALEPVFALGTAIVAGGERVTGTALTGGGLILAGILLVELRSGNSG